MIEDIPYHRRVLNETDNPHGPLTFRADHGIYFVYLLNQPGPTFPESFFVSYIRVIDIRDEQNPRILSRFPPERLPAQGDALRLPRRTCELPGFHGR